jgi:SM-20-related protein
MRRYRFDARDMDPAPASVPRLTLSPVSEIVRAKPWGCDMDVQVKLSLQGGHAWDFCCDEDDPIVFGLVSSLPGANLGTHATPDGLIQVQTRAGRLYITRSSLIGVEIIPIADASVTDRLDRFVVPSSGFSGGMAAPSPFVSVPAILSKDVHGALLEHALGQHGATPQAAADVLRLDLGAFGKDVEKAFQAFLEKSRSAFNLAAEQAFHIESKLFALGDAQALPTAARPEDVLTFVYHFHKSPRAFTGSGVRLFDGQTDNGMLRASDSFRDLEIKDNALLVFPSYVVCAGLPVHCPTKAFADGLFAVRGTLRKGAAA